MICSRWGKEIIESVNHPVHNLTFNLIIYCPHWDSATKAFIFFQGTMVPFHKSKHKSYLPSCQLHQWVWHAHTPNKHPESCVVSERQLLFVPPSTSQIIRKKNVSPYKQFRSVKHPPPLPHQPKPICRTFLYPWKIQSSFKTSPPAHHTWQTAGSQHHSAPSWCSCDRQAVHASQKFEGPGVLVQKSSPNPSCNTKEEGISVWGGFVRIPN